MVLVASVRAFGKVVLKPKIMAERVARVYIFQEPFRGLPKKSNFKLVEEPIRELQDGEFLVEALYLSVDPYMRSFASTLKVGKPFVGEQVAQVLNTKNSKFPTGSYVVGEFGWRTKTIATDVPSKIGFPPPRLIPDLGDLPKSLALGVLGMPGNAAYWGLLGICNPKEGETLVVSAAAGGVGSTAGQIGKIHGCHVVGIAGSDEKGQWLTEELGFDAYVNYKSPEFADELTKATPQGIDCYFDNVGGEVSSIVMNKMNKFGRVVVCGSISTYNALPGESPKASEIHTAVKTKHLVAEGLSVFRHTHHWQEGIEHNLQWIKEGKLKYKETIYEGFDSMCEAFVGLFEGKNIGKTIVKV